MAFDVTALADYTKENAEQLITSSIFNAKTQKRISSMGNVRTGIKTAEKIGVLETDAVFQTGGTCGFNPSGTTAITQRTITVAPIKVHEALCPKDLQKKYTQQMLAAGSRPESIPFEQEYTERKAQHIAAQLETAIWQGDTTSGNGNLNKFDGLIKIIDAAAGVVEGNTGGITAVTGITQANVMAIVDGMFSSIPVALLDKTDLEILCGWDVFRLYVLALRNANLYHYDAANQDGELVIPGTNIKLVALNGLNSTNRLYAFRWSNIFLGTDMVDEEEKFEIFYAKEADQVRYVVEWKTGVQIAFPNEIVKFTLV